ncbi:uncharacterized protein ACR2FA_009203 [Aphomia sociella]
MLYSELDDLQTEAEMICGTADSQERERDQFEDQYFELVALARSILADSRGIRVSMCGEETNVLHTNRQDFVRLPKIDLPHFSEIYTENINKENITLSTNIVQTTTQSHVLLSTALVQVSDANGRLHNARLLLDNGSTSHFVTRELCERLSLIVRNTSSSISVKALHLELVTDLTRESFLAALARFMSRRGKPTTIHSDNGTSFVGASKEIKRMLDNCAEDISEQGIEFKFIPPYTPHFGGLWEAAVKSVKYHLRRILSLSHLTYEEMVTCLVQIEAILNLRPLTPLSSNPSDLSYLSPAHFLIGRQLTSIPCSQVTDTNINRLQRHERIEKMRQHFWQRYSNEYISTLQQRSRWSTSQGEPLQVGAMVIVKDKSQPPLLWLLGRITKLSGSDTARVAEIHTKKGIIVRAYNNICSLPLND